MSLMKRINRIPPVTLVVILLSPIALMAFLGLVSAVFSTAEDNGRKRDEDQDLSAHGERQNKGGDSGKTAATIGSDVARFRQKYGDENFVYALLAPKNQDTDFRYFGFERSPRMTMFTADKDETVRAIALLKHADGRISDRVEWSETEIVEALRGFSSRPGEEWIEMDKEDQAKGFRVWADMTSVSSQGGIVAFYDKSYRGIVIGARSDIVRLMEDFQKSKIIDLRVIDINQRR